MLRIIVVALIWVVAGSSAVKAAILDRADIPAGYATALAFDLSDEKALRAELIALPGDQPRLSFLELPFAVKDASTNEKHVVFLSSRPRATFISYNVRPMLSSSLDLVSFEPIFNTEAAIDALVKSSGIQNRDNNLYFVRDGLRRLFMLRLPPPDKLKLEGASTTEIEVRNPDLVAVRLPEGFIGRTFHETGRMHDPVPIKSEPVIIFSTHAASPSLQLFRVLYDLPEPDWVITVSSIAAKFLGMLLPPLLLIFTNRKEVNMRRYKIVAGIIGFIYVSIYGYLIYLALAKGGQLSTLIQDLSFALATAIISAITYFATSRAQPSQIPPTTSAIV